MLDLVACIMQDNYIYLCHSWRGREEIKQYNDVYNKAF